MEKEEEKIELKKSKTPLWIGIGVLSILLLVGLFFLLKGKGGSSIFGPKVKITKNESSTIEYEKYDNGLVSMDIPKGWKVTVAPTDYIHYSFKVQNPKDPNYMLLFGLKQEGFLKSAKARETYSKLYPDAVFSKLTAIEPQTTEAFYKVWNPNAEYMNEGLKTEYLPYLKEFSVIENMGKSMLGGDIIRASYKDTKGNSMQGLFTSSIYSSGSYYINTDMWNLFSEKVDVAPLNVYNIILLTAPEEEFINWQPILDHTLSTIVFSKKFLDGFNTEEAQILATVQANQKVYDEISDMIMDSWEKRNNSYDIISQKQSDATLGYERVYDTDTGEIYKAQNGFMDHYDGTKYKSITEDMYTKPTAGYIE